MNASTLTGDYPGCIKFFGMTYVPENAFAPMDNRPSSGNFLFVTEYAEYGTLRDYIKLHQKYSKEEGLSTLERLILARQVAVGLHNTLHLRSAIHRDLHPGNVLMVNNENHVWFQDVQDRERYVHPFGAFYSDLLY
jgi:serine/threonine protein kinase